MRKIFVFILCLISTLLFSFDPPTNVVVDEEIGRISWLTPVTTIIESNFDDYATGDYIAVVDDNWTTWSNQPGGAEDALVTDAQSSSPSNSVVVEENDDLIFIMDNYTSGAYSFDMKMYVPTGYCGYFNLQKTSIPGEELAFQIYFQTDGTAVADMGAVASITHSFNHDEWMDLKIIIDLDNDWATYYFNGAEIWGYQWTLGTFGIPGLLQFGGVNIKGGANSTQPTDIPMFYMDDVVLSELQDVTGFSVYLDDMVTPIALVCNDVTEYTYQGLVGNQTYLAGVSALYDWGESEIITVEFTYPGGCFMPPYNLVGEVQNYNEVLLTWQYSFQSGLLNASSTGREYSFMDNSRNLAGYKVYRDGVEIYEIDDPTHLTYIDESLNAGTYEYSVTAFFEYPPGESCHTDPVSADIVLNPPTNISAYFQWPNIIITWAPPNRGVNSYNVYRNGVLHEEGVIGLIYVDLSPPYNNWIYEFSAVYDGGWESDLSVPVYFVGGVEAEDILVHLTKLYDNYPNPFNPTTTINFSISEAGFVSINIYNMKGQLVKTLVNENLEAAYHDIVWNGKDNRNKIASSGIYFYKMVSEGSIGRYTSTKKMILMK